MTRHRFVSDGFSYAIFGSTSFPAFVPLETIGGTSGFSFQGTGDDGAYRLAYAGDLNHDGLDDVLIGAWRGDGSGLSDAGETYVIYGDTIYPESRIRAEDLDGELGFVIEGFESGANAGSAHGLGDFNGDGFNDLVVGAPFADPNGVPDAGATYVIFGREEGFPARLSLDELDGENGFVLFEEERAFLGGDTSTAGDLNGDGLQDVVVGAEGLGATGAAYVVFGAREPFPASLSVSSLDGANGFAVIPSSGDVDCAGSSVASAGDVNGDGLDDLLVGNDGADNNGTRSGAAYTVYGRSLLELNVTGNVCPGPVEIRISGATPNAPVAMVAGEGLGASPIPNEPCGGLEFSVLAPRPLRQLTSDANGNVTVSRTLPAGACGRWLQAVDRTACRKSAARVLPEG